MGRIAHEVMNMNTKELTSLGTALLYFRGNVEALAPYVEQQAMHPACGLEIVAEGWERPAWGQQWRADKRLLECGGPVLKRVLAGWVPPTLDELVEFDWPGWWMTENELGRVRMSFVRACAEVAARYAAHGDPYPYRLDDGTAPCRVAPGAWPAEAAVLVPEAQAALTAYALMWLSSAGRVDGASFLPVVAA
ncbi:hypothetical protein DEGR_39740 (plasmid) [Deinococcus grandis]|nr:hypothetical protein DEGR_39740 [Deinococcus grandis]